MMFLLVWVVGLSNSAQAFQLSDHMLITLQAVQEYNECYPGSFTTADAELFVDATLDEDLNLIRKWTEYSHFYRPGVDLDMFRKGSMDRVQSLEPELVDPIAYESPYAVAGHIMHHLQDAAVPAHVVPVDHGFGDGFESYELPREDFADANSRKRCASIRQGIQVGLRGFEKLLQDSALSTLLAIRQPVVLKLNDRLWSTDWSVFWQDSGSRAFGSYGRVGNNFGIVKLALGSQLAEIDPVQYRDFKKKQVRQAIESTKKVLYLTRHL